MLRLLPIAIGVVASVHVPFSTFLIEPDSAILLLVGLVIVDMGVRIDVEITFSTSLWFKSPIEALAHIVGGPGTDVAFGTNTKTPHVHADHSARLIDDRGAGPTFLSRGGVPELESRARFGDHTIGADHVARSYADDRNGGAKGCL